MAGKGTKNNQQNTQGDAQTEQAVQTKPLDFDVRIHSIKPNESIKGTASVNINGACGTQICGGYRCDSKVRL